MPLPGVPTAKPIEKPNLEKHEEIYQSPVVDTRKESYDTLAAFPAGQRMTVDYYYSIQKRDTAAASFQEDLIPALGQLGLVRGFELVVTSPLSHSQGADDSRGWETTGSSLVYSVVTPNVGNVFIADIGMSMAALFQVTEVKRNTIYPEASCEIQYRATKALTAETMAALKLKTVETFIFDRENFRNGIKALIREEEVSVIRRLGRAYERLAHLYLRDFYSTEFKTLQVPGQEEDGQYMPTYDPYMTRFVRATIDSRSFPKVLGITELGVAHDVFSNQYSIFDAILRMDPAMLYSVSRTALMSDIYSFRARPMMNSIYFSGFKQVVTFVDIPYSVDSAYELPHGYKEFSKADVRQNGMNNIIPQLDLTNQDTIKGNEIPLIHRVIHDRCYILSAAFYDDTPGKSVLERVLMDRLVNETCDLQDLLRLAEDAPRWDNLERFYYYPLILALIKLAPGVL